MIFVTVGMHSQGFDRLLKKMDEIAAGLDEKVIMQIGSATYQPRNCEYFRFSDNQRIEELIRDASLVVSHAGAGILLTALSQGVKIIVVPRLKRFAEHGDDHQLELAEALSKESKILAVYDIDELEETLKNASTKPVKLVKDRRLVDALKEYITQLERK